MGKKKKQSKRKKHMKTSKKAFWTYMIICAVILVYIMILLWFDKDSNTLSILAGTVVAAIAAVYKIYTDSSDKEKAIHMEKNYNPNYDKEEGIY